MTNPRYSYTIDQTGHSEGFAVCTPEGRQMAYLTYDYGTGEEQAEADALLIVNALNAKLRCREIIVGLLWTFVPMVAFFGLLSLAGE